MKTDFLTFWGDSFIQVLLYFNLSAITLVQDKPHI